MHQKKRKTQSHRQQHVEMGTRDCVIFTFSRPWRKTQLGGVSPSSSELEDDEASGSDSSSESEESWPGRSKHFLQRLCIGASTGTLKKRAVPYRQPHGVLHLSGMVLAFKLKTLVGNRGSMADHEALCRGSNRQLQVPDVLCQLLQLSRVSAKLLAMGSCVGTCFLCQ